MSSHQIVETLREEILTGRIKAGQKLRQTALAERFGISRIPIRDAISTLANEKLVIASPNQSARVVHLNVEEHAEIFDLREILECHALSHAIRYVSDEELTHARHVHKRTCLEAGKEGWSEGDRDFHMTLYSPSGLHRTQALIFELRQVCRVQVASYDNLQAQTALWIEQHEEILHHSDRRDAAAAVRVLRAHISDAKGALFGASK